MGISLYEHNSRAYASAMTMLNTCKKAAIIHPTGTGKSFIAFKLCEEHHGERVCWLSPSEYIVKTQLENITKLNPDFNYENITFITYAKLMLMSEEEISALKPAYIILDEFHRCGAAEWGRGVRSLLSHCPGIPVLGLSATNIRYLDNQRNMADELFDGNIASQMTLGEAVMRGILRSPTYVVSMLSYKEELKKYEKRVRSGRSRAVRGEAEKYLEALRRALELADGMDEIFRRHMKDKSGKYIVFCADYRHMTEMLELAPEWFAAVDKNPHIYKAYSDDPETEGAFAEFKADESGHLKLLYCIDMLNEGIHIDGVTGVILLRPTVSPIIYKQQIGRALSASGAEEPIIFDVVNNFENLYSISAIQEEMRVAMTYYRDLGRDGEIVNEHFRIIDEVRESGRIFRELENALSISWDYMYTLAEEYYKKHGSLEMPKNYKTENGYSLESWIATQRKVRAGKQYGRLDDGRVEKLDKIGMRWESARDISWKKYYAAAERFYAENGSLDINVNYIAPDGIALGKWICRLRTYRKSGIKRSYLLPERIEALNRLGMIWSVPDYLWEQNYSAALRYSRENGSLDVPCNYITADGVRLGNWLSNLRRLNKTPALFNLSAEQVEKLDEIGMCWEDKYVRQWEKGFDEARRYFEAHGDLNVPVTYIGSSGFKLGDWISNQRENASRIKPERRARLDAIGMLWTKPDAWELRFALAKRYFLKNGSLSMPPDYVTDGVWLNKWLNEQKQIYYGKRPGKTLSKEQISRLEQIGMDWKSSADRAWERRYEAVFEFYTRHGHINIPREYVLADGKKIGNWLILQRRYYRQGQLPEEKIAQLSQLGMVWNFAGTLRRDEKRIASA